MKISPEIHHGQRSDDEADERDRAPSTARHQVPIRGFVHIVSVVRRRPQHAGMLQPTVYESRDPPVSIHQDRALGGAGAGVVQARYRPTLDAPNLRGHGQWDERDHC